MNRKRKKKISNKRLKSNPAYTELSWCLFNEPILSIIEKKELINSSLNSVRIKFVTSEKDKEVSFIQL